VPIETCLMAFIMAGKIVCVCVCVCRHKVFDVDPSWATRMCCSHIPESRRVSQGRGEERWMSLAAP